MNPANMMRATENPRPYRKGKQITVARQRIRNELTALACLAAGLVAMVGCQPPPAVAPTRPAGQVLDACADRLHDISGQLLLCYSHNGQLPKRLADLAEMGTGIVPPLTCPVSGKPYVYIRQGLDIPKSDKKVLVHDPMPCHTGKRWAVVADAVEADKPLVCRVVLIPDGPVFAAKK